MGLSAIRYPCGPPLSGSHRQAGAPPSALAGPSRRTARRVRSAVRSRPGQCARSRPWAPLSAFPRQARGEFGRPPRGVLEHSVPSARRRALLPAAGTSWPGRCARSAGFGSLGPRSPHPAHTRSPHALVLGSAEPAPLGALFAQGRVFKRGSYPRKKKKKKKKVQKDAVAPFQTKPNY